MRQKKNNKNEYAVIFNLHPESPHNRHLVACERALLNSEIPYRKVEFLRLKNDEYHVACVFDYKGLKVVRETIPDYKVIFKRPSDGKWNNMYNIGRPLNEMTQERLSVYLSPRFDLASLDKDKMAHVELLVKLNHADVFEAMSFIRDTNGVPDRLVDYKKKILCEQTIRKFYQHVDWFQVCDPEIWLIGLIAKHSPIDIVREAYADLKGIKTA